MERYQGGRPNDATGSSPVVPVGCRGEVNNSDHGSTHRGDRHQCSSGDAHIAFLGVGVSATPKRLRSGVIRLSRRTHNPETGSSNLSFSIRSTETLCRASCSVTPTVRPPSAKALDNTLRERADPRAGLSRDTPPRQPGFDSPAARESVRGIGRPVNAIGQRGPYSGPEVSCVVSVRFVVGQPRSCVRGTSFPNRPRYRAACSPARQRGPYSGPEVTETVRGCPTRRTLPRGRRHLRREAEQDAMTPHIGSKPIGSRRVDGSVSSVVSYRHGTNS